MNDSIIIFSPPSVLDYQQQTSENICDGFNLVSYLPGLSEYSKGFDMERYFVSELKFS